MRIKKVAPTHNQDHRITIPISLSLDENISNFEYLFQDCGDLVKRKFPIGVNKNIWAYIAYIDVMIDRRVIEESILEQLIVQVRDVPKSIENTEENIFEFIKNGGIATADVKEIEKMDDVALAVLSGDTVLFIDGYDKVLLISTKGWPSRGITEPDTEAVVKGSKEGFTEVFRFNTVLIRRRIRDTKLKIKQLQVGLRSRTDIGLVYLEDVAKPAIVSEITERLNDFVVDGVIDSGMLEQLMEKDWHSPFPKIQTTQRPDKAASAILEGRVVIIVDNSPFVLLLPTTLNAFFQASEDYTQRWMIMSFFRVVRYMAAFVAIALPGLYIALTTFHPSMIPTSLIYSFAASRQGVPFPAVIEVIIMELAFELLREAGVRLPGPIGNTIGIVGGLIIGQAVVEANLVSPIIVIIVAVTAISSFAIPNYSLTTAFILMKFVIIALSATLGLYGFWVGILAQLIHLVSLKSFGVPYLSPFVSGEINEYSDLKDSILRFPTFLLKKRPVFSKEDNRVRLKMKQKGEQNVLKK